MDVKQQFKIGDRVVSLGERIHMEKYLNGDEDFIVPAWKPGVIEASSMIRPIVRWEDGSWSDIGEHPHRHLVKVDEMNMKSIRDIFGVPAKRGGWVRVNTPGQYCGMEGRITSAQNGGLRVWFPDLGKTNRESVDPYDLDYRVMDLGWWRHAESVERVNLKQMELDAVMWGLLE